MARTLGPTRSVGNIKLGWMKSRKSNFYNQSISFGEHTILAELYLEREFDKYWILDIMDSSGNILANIPLFRDLTEKNIQQALDEGSTELLAYLMGY